VLTGFKILFKGDEPADLERNVALRLFRRCVPTTHEYHEQRFTIVKYGRRFATPLLAVLVLVEATDLVFALDSVPAVFAITDDPFIVFTSNVFAILGLRSLYFLLAGMMDRFHYLKLGLGTVLIFVGAKMALADVYKLPIAVSLGIIVGLLASAVLASLLRPKEHPPAVPDGRRASTPSRV
jgi:tellurite resistance protein TerC